MTNKQLSFRTEPEKIQALDAVAEALDRDRSYVLNQAVDAFLEVHRWQVEHIEKAVAEADAGGPFIAHEDVKAWLKARAAGKRMPLPKATIRKKPRKAASRS